MKLLSWYALATEVLCVGDYSTPGEQVDAAPFSGIVLPVEVSAYIGVPVVN